VIRIAFRCLFSVAGLDEDGAYPGISSALDVDCLVSDHEGACEVDPVLDSGLKQHAWRRFTPRGGIVGMVWGHVGAIDDVAELPEQFLLDRLELLHSEITAADATLVGDNDVGPAKRAGACQFLGGSGVGTDFCGIVAMIDLHHEGAISVDEECGL